MPTEIRAERPEDEQQVRRVNELAFGQPDEAKLVDALRHEIENISLVATDGPLVVGHIFFTPVSVENAGEDVKAAGLGPMAVLPSHQRRGIGSRLVREGLERCRLRQYELVVVLGHPHYYPRFGFVSAHTKGIRYVAKVPDEAFMVLDLRPEPSTLRNGVVRYHPEFEKF
jgi:putative acetyltransferase